MTGRLLRLSVKPRTPGERGLPKRSVAELRITTAGATGDYNHWRTREAKGDPDQALLLLTDEILGRLQAEGWPVGPGDLGENLTLGGIPESSLRPGTRLRLDAVLLEISKPCDPCTELYVLPYVGPERGPAFVRTLRGRRGWFARVLAGGIVGPDTPVEVEG